ncbi:hypothetical protein PPERSA_04420 [Pseudocohnilembus persalinus]|uniref:Nicotinamide-nucleotide adenylyltransferase n=1 Tax=Pseudocohnilembus persalinus TaxID=266149 RepID=A0A0V0QR13_PSEPJ|nr:hypothetical protein PPERSA_04420 [Pseudocohnilembus persalinus]|eukprot:KRX04605.1 hypothetical protein PPERSA_04420 [Pseudocohnilembus persalinus]
MSVKNSQKVVALLGGTFDPPTIGHFMLAFECINLNLANQVWLIPTGKRTDKQVQTSPGDRLKMTQLFLNDLKKIYPSIKDKILINPIEVENEVTIKTYFLLQKLKQQYPDILFKWIIGSDLANNLDKWVEGQKLKESQDFIIIQRPNYKLKQESLPNKFEYIQDIFQTNISSTQVRQRIQQNLNEEFGIQGVLSQSVIDYIQNNQLYEQLQQDIIKQSNL